MRLFLLLLPIFLTACSATDMSKQLSQNTGEIPKTQFSTANTVEEVRKLRPQAKIPIKVVVMPNRRMALTKDEREVINTWGDKLKALGFVKSMDIIPQSLIPQCGYKSESDCFLNASRIAGARMGADAILFINDSTVTDSYVNPLSFLNITIVGMWFVPAHHRDSYSVYEAALFDINNGYLYAVAEETGEYKALRPLMYAERDTGQHEARIDALNKVGQKLYDMAKEQMRKTSKP